MNIMTQVAIVLIVVLVLVTLMICLAISMLRKRKKNMLNWEGEINQKGAVAGATLPLLAGLPLAENTTCHLFVTESELIIEAQSQVFKVAISKIIAAQAKTDLEIQQEVTSSAGKAIAGALFFGPVGAIIGARTKTKKHSVITTYLIINYYSQSGETAVLAFQGADAAIIHTLDDRIQRMRSGVVTNL